MTVRYTLVGPNAGRTIKLGALGSEYPFVNGVYVFEGSDGDALHLDRILGPFYSAFRDDALLSAQRRYAELASEPNAPAAIVSEAEDEAADAQAAAAKAEQATKDAVDKALADAAVKAKQDQEDAVAKAVAEALAKAAPQTSAPAPQTPAAADQSPLSLKDVVEQLDPANDEHWTDRGLPSMTAIETLAGKAYTRAEVEAAAPGFNRAKAKAAADI